jgi:hypothetical protein
VSEGRQLPPDRALILTAWSLSMSPNPAHDFYQISSVLFVFETVFEM